MVFSSLLWLDKAFNDIERTQNGGQIDQLLMKLFQFSSVCQTGNPDSMNFPLSCIKVKDEGCISGQAIQKGLFQIYSVDMVQVVRHRVFPQDARFDKDPGLADGISCCVYAQAADQTW